MDRREGARDDLQEKKGFRQQKSSMRQVGWVLSAPTLIRGKQGLLYF